MSALSAIMKKSWTEHTALELCITQSPSADVRNKAAEQLAEKVTEIENLKLALNAANEMLTEARVLFDSYCVIEDSAKWYWMWRVKYFLGETDIPFHKLPEDME